MRNSKVKKAIVTSILVIFIGASVIPGSWGNVQNKSYVDENIETSNPLPRWREGGTPYDPEQSLYPYCISLREQPTSGLIESPPEYGPTDGVIFTFKSGHWHDVVSDLVVGLTADDEYDEIAYVVVSQSQKDYAYNYLSSSGADMDKVEFIIENMDSVWMRDYGPHFIWQDGALALVDSHYYPGRSLDNFIPTLIGDDHFIMPTYDMGLYYSGGNFQPGPDRTGFVTSLVKRDNPSNQGFDEEFIAELYQTYQGIDELHIMPQLPYNVDGTGHIDMWMQIVDEDTVIISEFKPGSNPTAIQITENAVDYMEDLGFDVYRTPAWNAYHPNHPDYYTHWTYTNAFRVNDRYFISTYGENYPDYADEDAQALAAYEAACGPNVEIIEIDCFPIIYAAGAIHCIVMQVPRYIDPEPSVHVIWPDGGEFLASGSTQTIKWVATDTYNKNIPQIDLYYSVDGGDSYEFIDSTTNNGFYDWLVPIVDTELAKIKVVAISEDSDEGEATSNDVFQIFTARQKVYDYKTGASVDKFCYGHQTQGWNDIDGIRTPVNTEISSSNYPKIANSDATGGDGDTNRYRSPSPSIGKYSTHIFEIFIDEAPKDIIDIEILWEGYADDCTQIELYIWSYFRNQWCDGQGLYDQNRFIDNWAGNRDGYLRGNIREYFQDFIGSNNEITLLLYSERSSVNQNLKPSFHDYISIIVSSFNNPPDSPDIDGQTTGRPNTSYAYTFTSTEPDGEDVSYYIDWGDGNITEWTDYQNPGTPYSENHKWDIEDTYEIKAKAKDINGAESDWSTLKVSIPRNRLLFNKPAFMRLLNYFLNTITMLRYILRIQ